MDQSFRAVSFTRVGDGLNNLYLAREHILQWKPALVIADFQGFMSDIQHIQQLSSVMSASETIPFILLHSEEHPEMSAFLDTFPLWASLSKTVRLEMLAQTVNKALAAQEVSEQGRRDATINAPGGEGVNAMDGGCQQPHHCQQTEDSWKNGLYLQAQYSDEIAHGYPVLAVSVTALSGKLRVRRLDIQHRTAQNYACALVLCFSCCARNRAAARGDILTDAASGITGG